MELKPGMSALVTGGASGIGKAICLALAKKGVFVTVVDFAEEKGKETVAEIVEENAKFYPELKFPSAMFIRCDVTNAGDIAAAFGKHFDTYGGLDICVNSAGVATRGVILFTRALTPLKRQGIRVNVLCPEFVRTEMGEMVGAKFVDYVGGYIPMKMVVDGALELIRDETKAGSCLWISKRRGSEYWPTPEEEKKYLVKSSKSRRNSTYPLQVNIEIPQTYEKIVVHSLSHKFRSATKIVRTDLSLPVKSQHVLVKIVYAGVNASDVNYSSGRYFSGNGKEVGSLLPFDAGFELGWATSMFPSPSDSNNDKFPSEVHSKYIIPVPRPDPEVVAMLTSGLTASIALKRVAQLSSGETVLVTAAAGGTGQFAVQLAKLAGNKVIATCGGEKKAALLKSLGVDRVIDYKKEDIKSVLKKEFSKGVDIIYESVGGEMFDLCLNALAVYGRLVVIGMISQYQGEHGWKPLSYTGLCEKILAKSQTVGGFFLVQYSHLWKEHMGTLFDIFSSGKLKVFVDPKQFVGLGSVADAVEYLHSGESLGKVVVCIDPKFSTQSAKL
ncbi:hypothetical protein QJS04_geneDACA017230 [Acorus gramineus]|uniref:Enoyl reductase (ER) domain-containing protein n=1 Tax=Acorus gramineus TaxID=55184 RepID=A0AAV8ZVT5_ACOGR|nr:hypothetical protein QJS04_geneDACA017230 [Acorus gramineus]